MNQREEPERTWFGIGHYALLLPGCQSLKDKRQRLRSAKARLVDELGGSVAEVAWQDKWQRSALGVAFAASSETGVDRLLDRVVAILERDPRVVVTASTAIVDLLDVADEGLPMGWLDQDDPPKP